MPAPVSPRPAIAATTLLLVALVLPWNLGFGITIPNSNKTLWVLLLVVTVFSVGALPLRGSWLRLAFNIPYLLLVAAFVAISVVQSVRYGGSVTVPNGVGPGAWWGIAGSLLSAQPTLTSADDQDDKVRRWQTCARLCGYAGIAGATMSFLFNLVWRIRYALAGSMGSTGVDRQSIAVIGTAVVYGLAALAAVVVASRIIRQRSEAARLVTIALGVSTLAAGALLWALPFGRELDAFHGIAQNTSTAGVGYEGYLAWAAAAAMIAPLSLRTFVTTHPMNRAILRQAIHEGLLLITVWCFASMTMRITDLAVAVGLDFPYSRYDSMTLAAFDLATAVLALWLRINLSNRALSARPVWVVSGFVFTLTVSRVILGIALAPRFAGSVRTAGPVYGNNLAQQITSTFDVVLCGVALCLLAMAILNRDLGQKRRRGPDSGQPQPLAVTAAASQHRSQPPRIFRVHPTG
ncbi:MAG: hypothetical protein K2Q25_10005 [Mycobacteriaceae bacterium]|nr:hypothetical protein [Mycobacteriaceae bacterium]